MAKLKRWIQAKRAKTSRAKNLSKSRMFLIFKARKIFTKLRQAFVKALILNHFDPKHHIHIETDISGYTIDGILG